MTDVIAEMFEQKMCRACGKGHGKNKFYNAKYDKKIMLHKIYLHNIVERVDTAANVML